MNIVLDIDGCLANFNLHYAKKFVEITGRDLFPEDWYRHPDKLCPVWDWEYHWGYSEKERAAVHEKIKNPTKDSKFWFDLPLMPFAKDSLTRLNNLQRYEGHNIYFMTHRFGNFAKLQTERWLYQYGIAYPTVLLVDAARKHIVLEQLEADIFIDDKLETVRASIGRAKRVYLKDMPYNQDQFKSPYTRVDSVKEMLEKEGLWEDSEVKKAMFWRKS